MQDYRQIRVWQKSYNLTLNIYKLTESFPGEELYGLTSQIRRAAISIPSNIAEGTAKASDKDFARFLETSLGSAFEVECQMLLAKDLGYVSDSELGNTMTIIADIKKMIYSFIKKLRNKPQS